jgi:hypothetical protein
VAQHHDFDDEIGVTVAHEPDQLEATAERFSYGLSRASSDLGSCAKTSRAT